MADEDSTDESPPEDESNDEDPSTPEDPADRPNPFEDLAGGVADREGDPFDHLEADPDAEGDAPDPFQYDAEEGASEVSGDVDERPGAVDDDTSAGGSDANSAAAASPGGTGSIAGEREDDPFDSRESAFQQMDVGELDADEVWADISDARERGSVVQETHEDVVAEVSKHRYCERCEYFSDPVEATCTHEGTEIIEFSGVKTAKVRNCPIVAERKELEDEA